MYKEQCHFGKSYQEKCLMYFQKVTQMMNKFLGEQIQRGLGGTLRGGWRLCSEPSTSCSYHKFVSAYATGMSHTVVGNTNLISPAFSMTCDRSKPVFIYSHTSRRKSSIGRGK